MDVRGFNEYYVFKLLDKSSKENKAVFLLGDFDIDLLKYGYHSPTNEFLLILYNQQAIILKL